MKMSTAPILVLVEHERGALRKGALEALSAAACWPTGGEVVSLALGPGAEAAARESLKQGVYQSRWLDEVYAPMRWLRAVAQVAGEVGARTVLFADSTVGRDLAPRLAVRTGSVFVGGVLTAKAVASEVRLRRQIFGGRFHEDVSMPGHVPVVVTWRGGCSRDVGESCGGQSVQRVALATDRVDGLVEVSEVAREGRSLAEADVVVCGGRGVGSREGFELVQALADALGGAPAASRAAVDAGFAPVELQVGQSGKTVSPSFYFALGISGSLQHRAGMRTSRCVVAINKDPTAPIFRWADYGMVGDVAVVVPALIRELKQA
jgi:electron transfer flavoprotein alpha subunit